MTGDVVEVLPTGTSTTVPATGLGGVAPAVPDGPGSAGGLVPD